MCLSSEWAVPDRFSLSSLALVLQTISCVSQSVFNYDVFFFLIRDPLTHLCLGGDALVLVFCFFINKSCTFFFLL